MRATPSPRYAAVIFDLFGTLVEDFVGPEYLSSQVKLAELFGVDFEVFRRVWRDIRPQRDEGVFGSVENDIAHACDLLGVRPAPGQIDEAVRIRLGSYAQGIRPRADALATLSALRAAGHKIGLISNCGFEIPRLWEQILLAPHFDIAVFSPDARILKPNPRIYLLACERLEVEPNKCLYVGDGGSYELAGARRVGMSPVLIRAGDGGYDDSQLEEARDWQGPVITSLSQLIGLVQSS